jgi:hypothetical protein
MAELKGMRSDHSRHSNYNGAQVTEVEKREIKIPIETQKQAVDLDEPAAAAQRAGRPG